MKQFLTNFALEPIDVPMIICGALFFYVFCKLFGKHVVLPYLRLFEAREAATEGVLSEARSDLRVVTDLDHEFNMRIQQARMAALSEKAKVVDSAKGITAELIKEAEATARHILDNEREVLKQVLEEERRKAALDEKDLVAMVVRKFSNEGKEGVSV